MYGPVYMYNIRAGAHISRPIVDTITVSMCGTQETHHPGTGTRTDGSRQAAEYDTINDKYVYEIFGAHTGWVSVHSIRIPKQVLGWALINTKSSRPLDGM